MNSKKKVQHVYLVGAKSLGLTEVMRPLSTSSQSITRIKKTSNIMLPAKLMVTAAWMRANLMV